MSESPVEISYRTTIEVPRTGPVGSVLRWLGKRPILGGFVCGLGVVAIAAAYAPGGFATEPVTAGLISGAVVVVWTILFFLMRSFFEAQSFKSKTVLRRLIVDDEEAVWTENDEPIRSIERPELRLLTNPVPEGIGDAPKGSRKDATAWPVWIVVDGPDTDERIVFETRDAARRARDYGEVSDDVVDETDERLPRAIASPLLRHLAGDADDDTST